jgi:dolichyl-phosphate-mannose-protein mannosyltransferase
VAEGRFQRLAALCALLATLHALVVIPLVTQHRSSDSVIYLAVAKGILHGGYGERLGDFVRFGGSEPSPGAPDVYQRQAYRTPAYPGLLALLGGGDGASQWVVLVVQALMVGAATWILARTVRRLWGERVALLGALLLALDPFTKRYAAVLMTEVLALLVLTATLYAVLRATRESTVRRWLGAGVLLGVLVLVRPQYAFLVPVAAAAAAVAGRAARRLRVLKAAAAAGAAIAVLVPWLGWTWFVLGQPKLTSAGPGTNLLVAAHGDDQNPSVPSYLRDLRRAYANPPSRAEYERSPNTYARWELLTDDRQERLGRSRYRERLEHEPGALVQEWLGRSLLLWTAHEDLMQPQLSDPAELPLDVLEVVTIGLFGAGLVLAVRRGGFGRWLAVLVLVYTPVIAVTHVEPRYGIPARGMELAFAALALVALRDRLRPAS